MNANGAPDRRRSTTLTGIVAQGEHEGERGPRRYFNQMPETL